MNQHKPDSRPTVEIPPQDHQPSKAELEEEIKIDATPEEVARQLVQPVVVVEREEPK